MDKIKEDIAIERMANDYATRERYTLQCILEENDDDKPLRAVVIEAYKAGYKQAKEKFVSTIQQLKSEIEKEQQRVLDLEDEVERLKDAAEKRKEELKYISNYYL